MPVFTRRSILRSLVGTAATLPFVAGMLPRTSKSDRTSPLWIEAVGLMRLINTVEAREHLASRPYVEPWVLNTAPASRELIHPKFANVTFDSTKRTIGPFRVFWSTSSDGSEYEVALVEPSSGFAVFSDTVGEIFSGDALLHSDPSSAVSLRGQLGFTGSSIGPGAPSVLATITGFFAPTLHAANCCSKGGCQCAGVSGDCPGGSSPCNIGSGSSDCNWCCQAQSDCQFCNPDGCIGGGADG